MHYSNHSLQEVESACQKLEESEQLFIQKAYSFVLSHTQSRAIKQHQLNTAFILAKTGLDTSTISAALVHEILFMEPEKKNEMKKELGEETTSIVEEIARLKSVKNTNYGKMPTPRLSKVIMGIATDFRSLFVELASQLDKIRHINTRPEKKKNALAVLVSEVYAPIAHKLGLYELEWEMKDLAFKYFEPAKYKKMKKLVGRKREEREKLVKNVKKNIEELLEREKIQASVFCRAKSFNSIYKKMTEQGKKFSEVNDLHGIRIICNSVKDCYRAMGVISSNFHSLGEYDDYIANPKKNKYQSIHTLFEWKSEKIEAQIRTWEMHRNAEEGIAAHWRYKKLEKDKDFDQRLGWIKQYIEWQRNLKKTGKRTKIARLEFGNREIFALTPKKEIVALPEKATVLDFAYAVHSDIGNKCKGAKVNGKAAKLGKTLKSGDIVEISTAKTAQCKPAWLNIVKTEKAKSRIRKKLGIKGAMTKKKKTKTAKTTTSIKKRVIAKCCNPLPGDEITGYKTTKRKVTIHSKDCPLLAILPDKRKIAIAWGESKKKSYSSKLKIKALERAGILIDLLTELEKQGVSINGTETKSTKDNMIKCTFDIKLQDAGQFERIRERIQAIPAVIEVTRQ